MAHDAFPADVVGAVEAQLRDRRYGLVKQQQDDASFGDTEVILERGGVLVRLVRDRGQWFVEAKAAAWPDWFAPTIWRALLTNAMPALEVVDFTGQGRMLFEDLDRIEDVAGDASARHLDGLRDWRARRAKARCALPPAT